MEDDEWFFNSFTRYNELQMFEFPNVVLEMDLTCKNNLCVALGNHDNVSIRQEILIFQFPTSIQTKYPGDWKIDRNMCFKQGYMTDSRLIQIQCLSTEEKLIISEENGVSLLGINNNESDVIRKLSVLPCEIQNTKISTNSASHLVAFSGPKSNRKIVTNYDTMDEIFRIEETDGSQLKLPYFVSKNLISFVDVTNGLVLVYDLRNGKNISTLVPESLTSPTFNTRWIPETSFNAKSIKSDESSFTFYLFSTDGTLLVYDSRNLLLPRTRIQHSFNCNEHSNSVKLYVNPLDENQISICGFDENVHVNNITQNGLEMVFSHDGHSYNNDEFQSGVRTICSRWLPFVSNNTLISSGTNTSFQVWQYKIS